MDPSDLDSASLEAQLATARAQAGAEDSWLVWLADARVHPGRFPSLPTAPAYVLYRAWCRDAGAPELKPFDFARLMLTRFRKVQSRWAGQVIRCYAVSLASAERLRAAAILNPATQADHELFTFAALRRATHPKDPSIATAQADAPLLED